jgi:hypothetical protein
MLEFWSFYYDLKQVAAMSYGPRTPNALKPKHSIKLRNNVVFEKDASEVKRWAEFPLCGTSYSRSRLHREGSAY